MSIPEAFKGAALEIGRLPSVQRPKYVARTAGLLVNELLGTLSAVPFGIRSLRLRNRLKNQKVPDTRGTLPAVTLAADINYGSRPRNIMDIYSPSAAATRNKSYISNNVKNSNGATNGNGRSTNTNLSPVVLFVHGGVWASGSKWHYSQMATRLAQAGCVVCVMEYTLYPQASVDCMVREVCDALSWIFDHIEEHGGDENEVSLFGHSAGAHLCAMALLHRAAARQLLEESSRGSNTLFSMLRASQCMHEDVPASDDGRLCTLDGRMPKRAVYAAGVFDIAKHYEFEEARGVHMLSTMERVMGGWAAMPARSPTTIVHRVVTCEFDSVQSAREQAALSGQTIRSSQVPLTTDADNTAAAEAAQGGKAAVLTTLKRKAASTVCLEDDLKQKLSQDVESRSIGEQYGWGSAHKRKRSFSEAEKREYGVVPPSHLLDPPERKAYYSSFELAGDAIAQRVGTSRTTRVQTQDGSLSKVSDGDMRVDPAASPDAAERFAACLSCKLLKLLPPSVLMSGSKDFTVPWHESVEFYRVLKEAGVEVRSLLYDDVGHAGFVTSWSPLKPQEKDSLQGNFSKGPKFMQDLMQIVTGKVRV